MDIPKETSNFMRKGAEGALAGILALGAFGNAQEAKAAEKATNTVEWWISDKSIDLAGFENPLHQLLVGGTYYLHVAADTTKAIGTNFNSATWQVYTPIFPTLPNFVVFQTNYFPVSSDESAWNGHNLQTSSSFTKIDQTTNSSGVIVNNYASIDPFTSGFHDVSTNFSSAFQGGTLASYKFSLTSDESAAGKMTNFRLGTVQMVDTDGITWKTVNPQKNIALANYSDFTVSSGPVPEPSGAVLGILGGAALALSNRRRYYSAVSDRLAFKKGKCLGTKSN